MIIEFTVYGLPQPAGSKRAFALRRRDGSLVTRPGGSPVINVTDANAKAKSWKNEVATAAQRAIDGLLHEPFELIRGPVELSLDFSFVRPSSHYGTGRNAGKLKASAPKYHLQKPDVLKLTRAVEDALTKIVWYDDCQIVVEGIIKCWGANAGVTVRIQTL